MILRQKVFIYSSIIIVLNIAGANAVKASERGSLIHYQKTYYVITANTNGKALSGFPNEAVMKSWGFNFSQAKPADSEDINLIATAGVLKLAPSTLAIDPHEGNTVYIIDTIYSCKYPFASSEAFLGLGFQFKNVVRTDLSAHCSHDPVFWPPITSTTAKHPAGSLVRMPNGTVVRMNIDNYNAFPSAEVFFSYGYTFDHVVPANQADLQVTDSYVLTKMEF